AGAVVLPHATARWAGPGDFSRDTRSHRLGTEIGRHALFPDRPNVDYPPVDAPGRVRILIWERGVGPTQSSGTGSCASLVAAAAFGGAARDADVIAPGGSQRVEWRGDSVYLTGWAEVLFHGTGPRFPSASGRDTPLR